MDTFISDISKRSFPIDQRVDGTVLRPSILNEIQKEFPDFDTNKALSISELYIYRERYNAAYLASQIGELSELDNKVLESMKEHSVISCNASKGNETKYTYGEKIADKVANFGGSWPFIIAFTSFYVIWIVLNVFIYFNKGFDPYPFVLLNLILSGLAAIQAPIIMMSQNRQENKDRERLKDDYVVNLKSELEVRALHEKVDHLMLYQQQELIDKQKIQIDMLTDILKQISGEVNNSDTK